MCPLKRASRNENSIKKPAFLKFLYGTNLEENEHTINQKEQCWTFRWYRWCSRIWSSSSRLRRWCLRNGSGCICRGWHIDWLCPPWGLCIWKSYQKPTSKSLYNSSKDKVKYLSVNHHYYTRTLKANSNSFQIPDATARPRNKSLETINLSLNWTEYHQRAPMRGQHHSEQPDGRWQWEPLASELALTGFTLDWLSCPLLDFLKLQRPTSKGIPHKP